MLITNKPLFVNYERLGELEKPVETITYDISAFVFPNFHSLLHNSIVTLHSIKVQINVCDASKKLKFK